MRTWIRLEDAQGNQFDAGQARADRLVASGAAKLADQEKYPPLSGANVRPRPAKSRTDLAGKPAPRQAVKSADDTEGSATHGAAS